MGKKPGSAAIVVALLLSVLAGCGKRGSPRPPLPRGPDRPGKVVARQIGRRRVIIRDVDGNRYEIQDWTALPPRSYKQFEEYL